MTDTVAMLVELLHRESARHSAVILELQRARHHEADAVAHRRRAERERDAAEHKIDEWISYSSAWYPLIPKRRLKELKAEVPKSYDREIRF